MSLILRYLCVLIAIVLVMGSSGCKKDDFAVDTGFVIWTGEFIDGGCGWTVSFHPDLYYQPWNLPDSYKVDSLPVVVTYKDLKKRPDCMNRTDIDGQIYIHKIESPL